MKMKINTGLCKGLIGGVFIKVQEYNHINQFQVDVKSY